MHNGLRYKRQKHLPQKGSTCVFLQKGVINKDERMTNKLIVALRIISSQIMYKSYKVRHEYQLVLFFETPFRYDGLFLIFPLYYQVTNDLQLPAFN